MNPPCARCKKAVYPVEKLSCLDKYWHKGCFNCEVCGLKLTMKTYKGYNKLPYCNTHYPTTKFTSVADTPENLRLKQQTKNQSLLSYHEEHKANLTQFHQEADTVEGRRLKQSQEQASHIGYTAPPPPQPSGMGEMPPRQPPQHLPHQQPPPPQYGMEPVDYNPASELESALGSVWRGAVQPPAAEPPPVPSAGGPGPQYVAVYDYAAADNDEVSFVEGDIIVEASIIDSGWMEGRVQRTGEFGMLPSNYVEPR